MLDAVLSMGSRAQTRAERRALGQFFTPPPVAALACAATIGKHTRSVLDPTCGPGRMLWAARDRLAALGSTARVLGIDIDPILTALARVPPGPRPRARVEVVDGDAFSILGGLDGPAATPARSVDLVIGNPPYVRYQSVARAITANGPRRRSALARVFPRLSESRRVDALIRACLIAPFASLSPGRGVAHDLRALHGLLAEPARLEDPMARLWATLVGSYSGLSDLSLPTWLLAWVAARPGGTIAFIANESPQRREYGQLLRYFQLRFLRPTLVVEPADTSWFPEAQVPASLQVFRVRPLAQALTPLHDRREDGTLLRLRLPHDADGARTRALTQRLAEADGDVHALDGDLGGVGREVVALRDLERGLLREDAGDPRRGAMARLEGRRATRLSLAGSFAPPPPVASLVAGDAFQRLADVGIETHQGLRTGCNTFFYVERDGKHGAITHADLGARKIEARDDLFRPVLRRQRDLDGLVVDALRLRWLAFVAGPCGRQADLAALLRFPREWREAWRRRGQAPLPSELSAWIDHAERTALVIRGRRTPIPQLSAVSTNARPPDPRRGPGPLAWWYSLPLAPRHEAPVFLARVTHDRPVPGLNDPRHPALIDSNFATFSLGRSAASPPALLALLSSDYVAACLEATATPMGGGALKVEAAHLRRLAVPLLDETAWTRLRALGSSLAETGAASEEVREQIDRVLVPDPDTRARLRRLSADLRRRRRERARRARASRRRSDDAAPQSS